MPMQSTAAGSTTAASAAAKHRSQPGKAVRAALDLGQSAGDAAAKGGPSPKEPATLATVTTAGYTVRQISRAERKGLDQVCPGLVGARTM